MKLPKKKIILPISLLGQSNGQLKAKLLYTCGLNENRLLQSASRSMRALREANKEAGFGDLCTTGTYLSLERQTELFFERYKLTKNDGKAKRFNGRLWYLKPGCAPCATPGKSNHGLALAADLCLKNANGKQIAVGPKWVWFMVNIGPRYGWYAELDSQPWHWVYTAGDLIPQAVLDYEKTRAKFTAL